MFTPFSKRTRQEQGKGPDSYEYNQLPEPWAVLARRYRLRPLGVACGRGGSHHRPAHGTWLPDSWR